MSVAKCRTCRQEPWACECDRPDDIQLQATFARVIASKPEPGGIGDLHAEIAVQKSEVARLASELAACRAERDEMRVVFGWNEGDKFVKADGEGSYYLDRYGHDRIRCTIGRVLYDEMKSEITTLRASLKIAEAELARLRTDGKMQVPAGDSDQPAL